MKKNLYIIGLILIGSIFVWGGIFLTRQIKETKEDVTGEIAFEPLAPEVERVLTQKSLLVEDLLRDPVIIDAVRATNQAHIDISLEQIIELDQRWRSSDGVDDFIRPFLTNEAALRLIKFQEDYPGFSEIFVTDEHGMNVGQTNKTTDYYQADEDWWVGGYNGGAGKVFHGPIEFDESAQAEAISLYIPVIDPENGRAIGVAKAVLNILAIKLEL